MSENVTFYELNEQEDYKERQIAATEKRLGLDQPGYVPADAPWRRRWMERTGGYEARLEYQPPAEQPILPPGWDQLTDTEKYLYQGVFQQKGVKFLSTASEYVSENLPWLAKGIGYVGKAISVLDWFAEQTERVWGTVAQFEHARDTGRVDEFFSEIGAVWKAASFYYDTSNFLSPDEVIDDKLAFYHDMPGKEELYSLRKKLLSGKTKQEVHDELMQELGPLAIRAAMTDALGHIFLDPGNIIFPKIFKIPSRFILKRGEILYKAGAYTDDVVDVARIAEKTAFEALDAARIAGKPLDESAALVQDAIKAAETLAEIEGKALSPWEKFVVGITGGMPRSLDDAVEWVEKAPKGIARLMPWNWFRLTPQSAAIETLERVAINTQALLGKDIGVDEAVDLIRSVAKGANDSPQLAHMIASAQGRAAQSWLKGAEGVVDDLYGFWQKSASQRTNLEAIARLLSQASEGEYDIHRVMTKLIYGEHQDVWDDLVRVLDSTPPEGLKVYHDILNTMRAEGTLSDDVLEVYGKLFKDMPYDEGTFKLHLMGGLWEWTAKQAVAKYGLKAAGFWTKTAEALKSVESLIFLRVNPKYPIINFLNNEITGIARGVFNMMSPEDVVSYWSRIGIIHPRLGQGIGMAGIGGIELSAEDAFNGIMKAYGDASGAISEAAQMGKGWLGRFANKIKGIGLPVDAGRLAQQVERSASMRFMTQGMIEGMNWYWRPRRGYDLLSDFNPTLAETLGDELVNSLHKTIQSNPFDFTEKLTSTRALNKSAQTVLEEAAERMGVSVDRIEEVFGAEFTQRIASVLDPAMQSGKVDDVRSAVLTIRKDIVTHIDDWMKSADPGEYLLDGPNGIIRVYGQMNSQYWDMFEGHLKVLDERIPIIRTKDFDEAGLAWDTLLAEENAAFGRFFDWRKKRIDGVLKAMKEQGLADIAFTDGRKLPVVISSAIDEETKAIQGFHKLRRKLYQQHKRAQATGKFADATEEASSWAKIEDTLRNEYAGLIGAQEEAQKTLDHAIELMVPAGQRDAFHNLRLTMRAVRREYMEWNAAFYEEASGMSSEMRKAYFAENYSPIRSKYIEDMHRMDRLGLMAMDGDAQAATELQRMADGVLGQIEDQLRVGGMAEEIAEDVGYSGRWFTSDLDDAKNYVSLKQRAGMKEVEITYVDIPEDELAEWSVINHPKARAVSMKPDMEYVPSRSVVAGRKVWAEGIEGPEEGLIRIYRASHPMERELYGLQPGPTLDRPFFIDQNIIHKDQPPLPITSNAVYYSEGGTILDNIEDAAVDIIGRRSVTIGDLDEATQAQILKYVDHVQGQSKGTQMAAMNYAAARRDSALLNYVKRTELDQAVNTVAPYAFWPMHSMWNWALWSLERPAVLANYMRLRRLYETAGGDRQIPARLRGYGMVPIKLPFWEDWMGEGVFINPLRIGLPIETFTYPFERYYQTAMTVERRTVRALEQMLSEGEITQQDYQQALQERSGPIWSMARQDAKQYEDDNWFDFASMLVSPHAPLMWAYRKAFKPDEPWMPTTLMPMTRDIKSITGYLGIGPPGGVNIEANIRRTLGLPEFDEWDDYRIDRMLTNMASTNEITVSEQIQAMIERSGPLFDEAKRRAAKEYGIRGTFGIVGIPVNVYPPGEERARELYDRFGDVIQAYKDGDMEAYKEFFEEYPEAKARLALFDTPEERARTFLVDELWSTYNGMPDLHKKQMREALGEDFQTYFLGGDRDTYSQMPIEVLQAWARMANGQPPGTLSGNAIPLEYASMDVTQQMQVFYNTRRQYFGDEIWDIQSDYFKMKEGAPRRNYLKKYPILKEYWDWRRDFMYRNPDLAPYIEEDPDKWPKYGSPEELARLRMGPNLTLAEWQQVLYSKGGQPLNNLVMDRLLLGEELPTVAQEMLDEIAIELGVGEDILEVMGSYTR